MTAPAPVPDGTTPPAEAVEAAREAFDEWLHRMHGVTSSCDHQAEAEAIAAAVVAALRLPDRDREAAAKALGEAAEAWGRDSPATRWLRTRASALRERRD